MGILGEDRITCGINDTYEDPPKKRIVAVCCLTLAIALLIIMCITLLTNDAAQNMAAWTFVGDFKIGAVVGLALLVSFPVLLGVWLLCRARSSSRLIAGCSLVAE